MAREALKRLSDRIENAETMDLAALSEITAAVQPFFVGADISNVNRADLTAAMLRLVDQCIPGWTISLTGKAVEPDGHWRCTLRKGTTRDNDEYIGMGRGPTVAQAIATALIRVAEMKS